MGDAQRSAGGGIEIGVEHAAAAAELQLEARALVDLQNGTSEMADEVGGGKTDELASTPLRSCGGLGGLRFDDGLPGHAGRKQKRRD